MWIAARGHAAVYPIEATLRSGSIQIINAISLWWIGWVSLALAGSGFVPTMIRTVPKRPPVGKRKGFAGRAIEAGARGLPPSFARMSVVLGLQLIAR